MSIDPVTSYEQAEAEAVERQDEARREQHYAEAVDEARVAVAIEIASLGRHPIHAVSNVLDDVMYVRREDSVREHRWYPHRVHLSHFEADYGLPALLRVLATALESDRG